MDKQNIKNNIENKFNIWIYVIALYISYIIGDFFNTEITMFTFINQLNMLFSTINSNTPYAVEILLRFFIPLISVGLFELFARVFYGLTNTFSLGALNIKSKDFVNVLRVFVIAANLLLGVLNLLYYFFNFLIPLGMVVLEFTIMSAAYLFFFLYLNKYYLDKKTAHRAFRTMALIYLGFTFFGIAGGILL